MKWQAKDISDERALAAVAKSAILSGVCEQMPEVPRRVVMAKLASMIRRRIIDGCACGCSGGFVAREDKQA